MEILDHAIRCVRVATRDGQLGVYAAIDVPSGAEILTVGGRAVRGPSRFSIQVGIDEHVVPGDEPAGAPSTGFPPWRSLNHACSPTAVLRGRVLVARVPLAVGDEVTFDYETTEWDMAEPFACTCGHPGCRGRIAGYRHLDARNRSLLAPLVAPHLLELARRAATPDATARG